MEIKEIKEKVKKLKDELKSKELKKEGSSSMGIALKMGTEFVAAVFVASFIGFHVDKWLQTTPIFIIIFFIIGSVAGILNVVRSSKMINKD
ncbi:AtpZ/AtpI family protein [Pelagibacteraceae bacterium]|jgi:ATP synthase protein I|nr:AtpZ/AtpI family protein [Pelagibacteraceae bacterium]MDB3873536.1 AtpZ/AtpI family protein [Pelagibacteraceae bacterium]|tara:strand:- start:311 stop:583 length:273 start_codon:yes stop_codon:yes gene_type:complete